MPTYEQLHQKHPEYDAGTWKKARALHAGGPELLDDDSLMSEVFPQHIAELNSVYKERKRRAFYIPYAGEIVNSLTAGLFSEELSIRKGEEDPDDYWAEFFEDCSPPGAEKQEFHDFLRDQLLTALKCRQTWTLLDFPLVEEEPATRKQEESAGTDQAYLCAVDPEHVFDWEVDPISGDLLWAVVHREECRRENIGDDRNTIIESWMVYTATGWEKYEVSYQKDSPPQGKEIPKVDEGRHSFGRVPLIRLDVGEELWVMAKIMSTAIAHFNQRNALSWAQLKSLFPVMVAYLGPVDHMTEQSQDPDRGSNQTIGQGYILSMAGTDKVEYVGPDSSSFSFSLDDLQHLRDEMHRVVHQMAMSVDNSGAALQRSADSKQADQQMTALLLSAYAKIIKEHALRIVETIDVGRSDDPEGWDAQGMDSYDEMSLDTLMSQAETLDTVSVPSATWKRLWCFRLAQRTVGDYATDEELDEIRKELENNITNEDFLAPEDPTAFPPGKPQKPAPVGNPSEIEASDEEDKENGAPQEKKT